MKWRVKLKSNDELRQRFIDMTIPQTHAFGLVVPDPDLKFNATTNHWEIGPINWDEFRACINGNGPCNRARIDARKKAHEQGRWVREAAVAYASKQQKKDPRFSKVNTNGKECS